MPIINTYVPPALFFEHQGMKFYHVYPLNVIDNPPFTHTFSRNGTETSGTREDTTVFSLQQYFPNSVLDFKQLQSPEEKQQFLQNCLKTLVENGLFTPVVKGKYDEQTISKLDFTPTPTETGPKLA